MTMETNEQREAVVSREQIAANLRAWIQDLRTTTAKQGKGKLRTKEDAYCCLGRACVVLGIPMGLIGKHYVTDRGTSAALPVDYWPLLGLSDASHDICWEMNDRHGKTFPEIADYIEREILPRYTDSPVATPAKASVKEPLSL